MTMVSGFKVQRFRVQGFKGSGLDSTEPFGRELRVERLVAGRLVVSGSRRGLPYAPVSSDLCHMSSVI